MVGFGDCMIHHGYDGVMAGHDDNMRHCKLVGAGEGSLGRTSFPFVSP